MIVWLNVPFEEKDVAKRIGALWSPSARQWYVKNPVDIKPFKRWLPCKKGDKWALLRAMHVEAKEGRGPSSRNLMKEANAIAQSWRMK